MTIARRFLNMARSELNSLLDLAAKHTVDDDDDDDRAAANAERESLHGFSAKELEEELQRRRSARQEVEDAIHGRPSRPDASPSETKSRPGADGKGGAGRPSSAPAGGEGVRVQRAYATLEVPVGADFATVRKSYRSLMRKYHPDHHTETAEKQRAANEVAQRLTEAYKLLEKRLRK